MKYKRMIAHDLYTPKKAIKIIAELNAAKNEDIRQIIADESEKEKTLGSELYRLTNQVNLKNGRW